MQNHSTVLLLVAAAIMGCSRSNDVTSTDVSSDLSATAAKTESNEFYSVGDYDPARSADADLLATVQQAEASNRRIILEIGGHW